tara:strand:- start:471 stop:1010 length:540 start_codon:yes stop_codon:yes gene_type:complete
VVCWFKRSEEIATHSLNLFQSLPPPVFDPSAIADYLQHSWSVFSGVPLRILVIVLVAAMCLWALSAVALNFLGIDVYWPFYVASEEPIPHHRLLIARNGVFLTFAFYGLMFLRDSYEKVYPVHFLKTYLFMTAIAGSLVYIKLEIYALEEVLSLVALLIFSVVIHIGSKSNYRRYFTEN